MKLTSKTKKIMITKKQYQEAKEIIIRYRLEKFNEQVKKKIRDFWRISDKTLESLNNFIDNPRHMTFTEYNSLDGAFSKDKAKILIKEFKTKI